MTTRSNKAALLTGLGGLAALAATLTGCDAPDSTAGAEAGGSSPHEPPRVERTATPLERWSPPREGSSLRLLDERLEVRGKASAIDATLASYGPSEIATWRRSTVDDAIRVTTPRLPEGLGDTTRVRLRARAGGAERLRVIPHLGSPASASAQRLQRAVEVPLDTARASREAIDLSIDVADVIRGTWEDAGRQGRLLGFEFDFVGADDEAELERVTLQSELAAFAGRAGGAQRIGVGDVLRPSVFVHPRAEVRVTVTVPDEGGELRWHDATVGRAGPRTITVVHRGQRSQLARLDGSAPRRWQAERAPLDDWAGERIALEFATGRSDDTERPGVGLFGNPRIVSGDLPPRTPDVILYLIDTLRADRLGAHGYDEAGVSPTMDRLAEQGVAFERLISSSSWTKPAIPTLFTGLWPTTHRVGATANTDRLPSTVPMLQERFTAAGWRTGSFTANPLGSTLSGLERGFDTTVPPRHWQGRVGALGHPSATQLHRALLSWIDAEPDRPFFAFVHTVEVHEYHRPMYQNAPSGLVPYDAAVKDADRKLGALVDALKARGRDRNLLLVVTSDHGESLGEHGIVGHGMSLHQQELHVPLIFWAGESIAPGRVDEITSLADIAPTLLGLCGLSPLEGIDGLSFAAPIAGGPAVDRPFVPAALMRVLWRLGAPREHAVLTADLQKLIRVEDGQERAYDLRRDPKELAPLPETPAALARALEAWIEQEHRDAAAFDDRFGPVGSTEIDADAAERLRSLGYLD